MRALNEAAKEEQRNTGALRGIIESSNHRIMERMAEALDPHELDAALDDDVPKFNNPNGLCFHAGRFHAFFQHLEGEGSSAWDWAMAWGHASSSDLALWRREPVALRPTTRGRGAAALAAGAAGAGAAAAAAAAAFPPLLAASAATSAAASATASAAASAAAPSSAGGPEDAPSSKAAAAQPPSVGERSVRRGEGVRGSHASPASKGAPATCAGTTKTRHKRKKKKKKNRRKKCRPLPLLTAAATTATATTATTRCARTPRRRPCPCSQTWASR